MREPSDLAPLYAWHRDAIARRDIFQDRNVARVPIVDGEPQLGWYRTRFFDGGPWVAARIWLNQVVDDAGELIEPETICCEIDGQARDAEAEWLRLCSEPVSADYFDYLVKLRRWQRANARDELTEKRRRVDHLSTPILTE